MPPDLPPVSKGNLVSSICLPLALCHSEPLSSALSLLCFCLCHWPSLPCQPSHFLLPDPRVPGRLGSWGQTPQAQTWQGLSLFPALQVAWESLRLSNVQSRVTSICKDLLKTNKEPWLA